MLKASLTLGCTFGIKNSWTTCTILTKLLTVIIDAYALPLSDNFLLDSRDGFHSCGMARLNSLPSTI